MPFGDVLQNLGDAIAGVDRTGAYIKGQKMRAEVDQTKASTDASMELAKQRRIQAERDEMERAAIEKIQRTSNAELSDPNTVPLGDLIAGKGGSDYSGAMQGRNYSQQFNQRQTVGTPAGGELGDQIVTPDMREAAMDALAPAAAIGSQRPRAPGAPVIAQDADGNPIYVSQADAPGRKPASRPLAPRQATPAGPTSQQRNIDDLKARGVDEETAIRVVYNELADPDRAYQSIYNSLRRNFTDEGEAAAEAQRVVDELGVLEAPLIPDENELPHGSKLIGHTASGAEVYETPDGEHLVVE